MPPVLLMLKEALVTAQAASADPEKLAKAQKAYEDAIVQRKEARQDLAKERLAGACTTPPSDCDMAALSAAITVAEEEGIEEQLILDAKAHEFVCRKTQSEDKLLPLAQPQLLTHDGFGIIEDLKLALEEANGLAVEGEDQAGPLALEGADDLVVVAQAAAFFGDLGFQGLVLLEEVLVSRELGRLIEHVAAGAPGISELLAQVDHLALGGLAGPFD
jgi:hypothetical protein